jgi:phosphoribosylaminoimidazole (AIR) synthetase
MNMGDELTYAGAGVDIDKANELTCIISEIAKRTSRS